ncbi:MAG: hypothetical protein QJR02_07995 [Sinobacteraceae bacterium]|nr:hypothetical protein [Nevskiaceae bacterium]
MEFKSILFKNESDRLPEGDVRAPDCFRDLHLDQIVAAIAALEHEYDLTPFFYAPLRDVDAVAFRHEVMRDLENAALMRAVKNFTLGMRRTREHLAQLDKRYTLHQKERWFLDAVNVYVESVNHLIHDLSLAKLQARGLQAFREYLARYTASERFTSLVTQAQELATALARIRYSVVIRGLHVDVLPYAGEADYGSEVLATFERFRQASASGYEFGHRDSPEMDRVESEVLEGVARIHAETFSRLAAFWAENRDFLDDRVVVFDREIRFYIAYLDHLEKFKKAGLAFCYPHVSDCSKEFRVEQGFDLALAEKLIADQATPVCNDFHLTGAERILVVTGPNQGGKTTTARTFGQLHYLGSLGCPVPGREARLFLPDRIFTHFEREERMADLRGKLEDDLVRIRAILEHATPRSVVVINEIFASTAVRDAWFLSEKIASALIKLDVLCVWVTFIDEVASLGPTVVSMVTTVDPENPAQRTFKVIRRRADGLAYALAIAEKHRLTYEMILERTSHEGASAVSRA